MFKIHLLFENLHRIYAVVDVALRRRIRGLFILMTLLGLTELASIMALTGFFTILNAPAQFAASVYAQKFLAWFPGFAPTFADHRRLIMWACLLPIAFIVGKNLLSALAVGHAGGGCSLSCRHKHYGALSVYALQLASFSAKQPGPNLYAVAF